MGTLVFWTGRNRFRMLLATLPMHTAGKVGRVKNDDLGLEISAAIYIMLRPLNNRNL